MDPRRMMTMLGMFACRAAQAAAQGGPNVVSFSAELGELPEGFQVARTGKGAPAAWSVVEDSSVPGGRVLAQTSSDQTDYRFPLGDL